MRKLVLIAAALFCLTTASSRTNAAVVVYDLTLTPVIGSAGGFGTLQLSDAFNPVFQNISPFTTTPNVDLFTITVGGKTFDFTDSFINIRVINGVFTNFRTAGAQSGQRVRKHWHGLHLLRFSHADGRDRPNLGHRAYQRGRSRARDLGHDDPGLRNSRRAGLSAEPR